MGDEGTPPGGMTGGVAFCIRCWCSARALAMALFSIAPAPTNEDELIGGFLAIPNTPNAVEFGLML